MAIKVYHRQIVGGYSPPQYFKVAEVDLPDDRYVEAFWRTNKRSGQWWENEGVTRTGGTYRHCRSSKAGDHVVLSDGRAIRCADMGWEKVGKWGDSKSYPLHPALVGRT